MTTIEQVEKDRDSWRENALIRNQEMVRLHGLVERYETALRQIANLADLGHPGHFLAATVRAALDVRDTT